MLQNRSVSEYIEKSPWDWSNYCYKLANNLRLEKNCCVLRVSLRLTNFDNVRIWETDRLCNPLAGAAVEIYSD